MHILPEQRPLILLIAQADVCQLYLHFVAVALDESVILVTSLFSLKTIAMSCNQGGTQGGANVNRQKCFCILAFV